MWWFLDQQSAAMLMGILDEDSAAIAPAAAAGDVEETPGRMFRVGVVDATEGK